MVFSATVNFVPEVCLLAMKDVNHTSPESVDLPRHQGSKSAADIATTLRNAITEGHYAYNERLPPERDLAIEFGSSRGTVRSALQKLDALGLVSRRIGSGTFVTCRAQREQEDIERIVSPLELIDVRIAIEPHIVKLAVLNANARDLDRLEEALSEVEGCGDDIEKFTRTDAQFHLALAECTGNALMIWLYRHINNVRSHRQWSAIKDKILSCERIREYNRTHSAIFDAIRLRDAEAAMRNMNTHLATARDDLFGAVRT